MSDKFEKTDKDILDFYGLYNINHQKTRLDGVIYHDKINNVLYQQNEMSLGTISGLQTSRWVTVTEDFQYRPDKLAYAAYGDEKLYWIILQHNKIIDPFELELGAEIELPNIRDIQPLFDRRKEVSKYKKLKK